MERLTCIDLRDSENMGGYCIKHPDKTKTIDIINRLAHYEDLAEQGRLVELPCKIGDTIYKIPSEANYKLNVLNGHSENNRVYEQVVCAIKIYPSGYLLETCDGQGCVIEQFFKELWFLARSEAEQALAERKE